MAPACRTSSIWCGCSDGAPGYWPGSRCAGHRAATGWTTRRPARGAPGSPEVLGGEPLQDRHLLGVGPATRARDLEDERQPGEPRLAQQRAKSFLADLTFADVGVPVPVRGQAGDRVVAVNDLDLLQPDHAVELVDRLLNLRGVALVVTRREGVACVEADGHALVVVERVEHLPDLLELRAHAAAETGVVLDQQPRPLRLRALEHVAQVLGDLRQSRLETSSLVRAGMEDHAVDAELIGRLEVAGERALRALAQRRVVAGEVDQVDGVEVKGRPAVLRRRLLEGRDPGVVQLGRPPKAWRSRVDLYGFGSHRLRALISQVKTPRRVDVGCKNGHSGEGNSGPIWHAEPVLSVFVMGDLDLAIRGRTYREPEGPHSMVVRGRDLDAGLQHIAARAGCRSSTATAGACATSRRRRSAPASRWSGSVRRVRLSSASRRRSFPSAASCSRRGRARACLVRKSCCSTSTACRWCATFSKPPPRAAVTRRLSSTPRTT